MRNYILFCLLSVFPAACTTDRESVDTPKKDEVVGLNTKAVSEVSKHRKETTVKLNENKEKENPKKEPEDKEAKKNLRPQLRLLQSLSKGIKIEFAPLDMAVIKEDTTILSKDSRFEIAYATNCLNDSLIAQEMYDYGRTNAKSYLISHNYQTNISIKVNGILKGNRTIQKDLFKNKMDGTFLEKSILKHPRFVRFNEDTNEAVFEFIVGIPNTDWLVVAGVNLNESGSVRIIDVVIPPGM